MCQLSCTMYPFLFFDLDGTLTESGPGIIHALGRAFRQMGLESRMPADMRPFIGPPLRDSLEAFCGITGKEADRFIRLYRRAYEEEGILKGDPYAGIPELLRQLREAGYTLCTATSKMRDVALLVLEKYALAPCFAVIGGGEVAEGQDKAAVIRRTLETAGARPADTLMIGDRKYDVLGARACGMDCVGVLYGYGDRKELEAAGARYIVSSVDELSRLLLGRGL